MAPDQHTRPILLVPGFWLGAWAWDDVVPALGRLGHETVQALTLPGLEPDDTGRAETTHADQAAWLLSRARQWAEPPVVVAHSGASFTVSALLDAHPESVAHAVYVDGGPLGDGARFDPDLPAGVTEQPLPAFDVLARSASLDGLTEAQLAEFRRRAVPEPGRVVSEPLHLANPQRRSVPTTIIACSISAEQLTSMAAAGHPMFAEVPLLTDLEVVDLPTGHWPMWSRPEDLAELISKAAA